MAYLYEYLMFLAQAITIVIALVVVISTIAGLAMKGQRGSDEGHLVVRKINDRMRDLRHTMEDTLLPEAAVKKRHKRESKAAQQALKAQAAALKAEPVGDPASPKHRTAVPGDVKRVFVLHFDGDIKASGVQHLRTEVSAVLTMATTGDEVVVCLESPGGLVHSYGLAASQLMRVRRKNIALTVVVDKVAASGGYLMAAVANRIIAAPFALIGSIGVVAQVPNVHRLLKKNDVDVEVLTAGKYKRTLTVLGENTQEGREKFIEELEDVHLLFQEFVAENRPDMDLGAIATGEAWYGRRALDLKLVDELATSDEYLMARCEERDVFEVRWEEQKKPIDKLLGKVSSLLEKADDSLSVWRNWGGRV